MLRARNCKECGANSGKQELCEACYWGTVGWGGRPGLRHLIYGEIDTETYCRTLEARVKDRRWPRLRSAIDSQDNVKL